MASGAGAAAEGIQAGWQMGLQSDELALRKQAQAQELGLRSRDQQLREQEADQRTTAFGLSQTQAQIQALTARRADIQSAATAAKSAGLPVDPAWGDEFNAVDAQLGQLQTHLGGVTSPAPGPLAAPASLGAQPPAAVAAPATTATTPEQQHVAQVDQRVADLSSRLKTGQIALSEVDPSDLALMVTAATGRPPSQVGQLKQGLADWHAGMETQNPGLIIQGLNTVYGPQLQKGVGDVSPHGGHIVKKEIIGLDPAASADGSVHTDKVIPRLRVTTDVMGADGKPLYYDAPMTVGRTTDPNDPPLAISVQGAADRMGKLNVLVSALDHPEIAKAAAAGEAAAAPEIQKYLKFNAMTTPANPAEVKEHQVQAFMKAHGVDRDTAVSQMIDLGVFPYHPQRGDAARLAAAQQMVADGDASDVPTALGMLHPNRFMGGKDNAVHPVGKYGTAVGPSGPRAAVGGAGGAGAGGEVANAPPPKGTINPITNSAVLPVPDKNGLIMGYTPRAIDDRAFAFAEKGPAALQNMGQGAKIAPAKKMIENRAGELMERAGISAEQYAGGTESYKASARSLATIQLRADATDASMNKVVRDIATLQSTKVAGNPDFVPWLNKPINAVRAGMGSGPLAAYTLALKQVATEYERLLNGGQLSVAQLHVGAQNDAKEILNGNMNLEQVDHVLPIMLREMDNARDSWHDQLKTVRGRLSTLGNGGASTPAPAAAPAGAKTAPPKITGVDDYNKLAAGAVYLDPNGVQRTKGQ